MTAPGREMDIAIAKVLGYTVYHYDKDQAENCYYMLFDPSNEPVVFTNAWRDGERKTEVEAWNDVPKFSTNDAAALALLSLAYWFDLERNTDSERFDCAVVMKAQTKTGYGSADTIALAICAAALDWSGKQ